MKEPKKFLIVTPCYNGAKYLEETILSVCSQVGDFYIDYYIIDGASTDSSVEIIEKYDHLINDKNWPSQCLGINFNWVSKKDSGMYNALNKGFSHLTDHDYMCWLNSDDKFVTGALSCVNQVFLQFENVSWVMGRIGTWNREGAMIKNRFALVCSDLISKGYYTKGRFFSIQQESTFWRSSLWKTSGSAINESLKYAGDYELWLRFSKYSKLYCIDSVLSGFRDHDDNFTEWTKRDKEIQSLHEKSPSIFLVPTWCNHRVLQLWLWLSHWYFQIKKTHFAYKIEYDKKWVIRRKAICPWIIKKEPASWGRSANTLSTFLNGKKVLIFATRREDTIKSFIDELSLTRKTLLTPKKNTWLGDYWYEVIFWSVSGNEIRLFNNNWYSIAKQVKNKYDACIVPFYNDKGQGYFKILLIAYLILKKPVVMLNDSNQWQTYHPLKWLAVSFYEKLCWLLQEIYFWFFSFFHFIYKAWSFKP